jgi:hypothetical protein
MPDNDDRLGGSRARSRLSTEDRRRCCSDRKRIERGTYRTRVGVALLRSTLLARAIDDVRFTPNGLGRPEDRPSHPSPLHRKLEAL